MSELREEVVPDTFTELRQIVHAESDKSLRRSEDHVGDGPFATPCMGVYV
jgi:hypothetical protein